MSEIQHMLGSEFEIFIMGKKRLIPVKIRVDENGCWNCVSHAPDKDGYIRIEYRGRHTRMHRAFFKLFYDKDLPDDISVQHSCNNRSCCYWGHLTAGTALENANYREKCGRTAKGERVGSSKLTEEYIREIRKSDLSIEQLVKKYNVSRSTIKRVLEYKTWKHIVPEILKAA